MGRRPQTRGSWVCLAWLLIGLCATASAIPFYPQNVKDSSALGGTAVKAANYTTLSGTTAPFLIVEENATLTLQHMWIDDRANQAPWDLQSWSNNLGLPTIVNLTVDFNNLVLLDVTVFTTCSTVRSLQNSLCTQLASADQLLLFQILENDIIVLAYEDSNVSVTNLTITCRWPGDTNPVLIPPTNASLSSLPTSAQRRAPASMVQCAVAAVRSWNQVQVASAYLQTYATKVHLVLAGNVSIGEYGINTGDVPVYGEIHVHGPYNTDVIAWMKFGFRSGLGTFTLTPDADLSFTAVTFLTLPLGPYNKYPWSTLGWPMWMINMNRCQVVTPQVHVQNCTLVMPPETMDYMSHWVAQVSSPFPDIAAAASWYTVDATCNPPQPNPYLLNQVKLQSQHKWVTENATGFGVQFFNTTFTDTLPPGTSVTVAPLQLTLLFNDPYMPFPDIAWAQTPQDLLKALSAGNASAIVVLQNMSFPQSAWDSWPNGQVNVSSRVTQISGWPARPTYLDLQRLPNTLYVTNQLTMRNMLVMNGAQSPASTTPQTPAQLKQLWAANLTMLEWSFEGDRSRPLLQLKDVTLIIPPSEYQLLLSSAINSNGNGNPMTASSNSTLLLGPDGTITGSGAPGTFWGGTAVQAGRANIGVLVEDGMIGYNVTLLSQPPDDMLPFPNINITVTVSQLLPRKPTGDDVDHTATVVAITVPVTVVVLSAIVTSVILLGRRALQGRKLALACETMEDGDSQEGGDKKSHTDSHNHTNGHTSNGHDGYNGYNGDLENGYARKSNGPGSVDANGHGGGTREGVDFVASPRAAGARAAAVTLLLDRSGRHRSSSPAQTTTGSHGHHTGQSGNSYSHSHHAPSSDSSLMVARRANTNNNTNTNNSSFSPHPTRRPSSSFATPTNQSYTHSQTAAALYSRPASNSQSSVESSPASSAAQQDGAAARGGGGGGGVGSASRFGRRPLAAPHFGGVGALAGLGGVVGGLPEDDYYMDSFDLVPEHHEQLLINCFDLSKDLQASISMPDVASQLKAMVSSMQSELGDQEVEVTRVIGQGGGGVVYQGTWRGLTVAVKTMTFSVVPMQPMSRRQHRAMNEAAICKTLQHPNIVATYAYDVHALTPARYTSTQDNGHSRAPGSNSSNSGSRGNVNGTGSSGVAGSAHGASMYATEFKLYIIQEYCDGGSLKAAVEDGKLHDRTTGQPKPVMSHILQLATDIAAGLAHVHSRCVVHGDLTPANILLKPSPTAESGYIAKIADFGLSWKLAQGQAHISNARQGTSFYIAPEVLHVGIMSKAADVFSFGMVLHEMYQGEPFWRSQTASAASVALRRPGAEQLVWQADVPQDLKILVESCLASDPQLRPSMFQVVEQLLAMQRTLWANEDTTDNDSAETAKERTSESGLAGTAGVAENVAPTAADLARASRGRFVSGRHPTSGLLDEREVKLVYNAVRSTSFSWSAPATSTTQQTQQMTQLLPDATVETVSDRA